MVGVKESRTSPITRPTIKGSNSLAIRFCVRLFMRERKILIDWRRQSSWIANWTGIEIDKPHIYSAVHEACSWQINDSKWTLLKNKVNKLYV